MSKCKKFYVYYKYLSDYNSAENEEGIKDNSHYTVIGPMILIDNK
jgi:hypothetical protein